MIATLTDLPKNRLALERKRWYAWEMLPGYGSQPYYSPIRVDEIRPLQTGKSLLELTFFNAAYASGVQNFKLMLRVLKREQTYLAAEITDSLQTPTDRLAIISEITLSWLGLHFRHLVSQLPPPDTNYVGDVQAYVEALVAHALHSS